MDSGVADEIDHLRPEPGVLEHSPQSPPPQEMASPPVPGELLEDIFLRLPDPADLFRASAACVSFRRIIADRSFIRQYRKIHAPPFLGILDGCNVFHPCEPPHPSAPAASAVALAADFSFSFLPDPASDWVIADIRDGRVLLEKPCHHGTAVSMDMVVCDPLHRRYLLLPLITSELAASVEDPLWRKMQISVQMFLVPTSDSEEAPNADETSFTVIWMSQCKTRLVSFAFSSITGQWRAVPSQHWSDLSAGLPPLTVTNFFHSRQYVHGCFYWATCYCEESKLLVLDIKTMEFSIANPPPEANGCCDLAIVEAGEGRLGMFVLADGTTDLCYTIRQNDGQSSGQWQKVKTITLGSGSFLICSTKKYLLLYQPQYTLLEASCFALDIETFQLLEKVCTLGSIFIKIRAYSNFPPSLLSSPTVSSGVELRKRCWNRHVLQDQVQSHHGQTSVDANDGGQARD